jgi:hypothetical protein
MVVFPGNGYWRDGRENRAPNYFKTQDERAESALSIEAIVSADKMTKV